MEFFDIYEVNNYFTTIREKDGKIMVYFSDRKRPITIDENELYIKFGDIVENISELAILIAAIENIRIKSLRYGCHYGIDKIFPIINTEEFAQKLKTLLEEKTLQDLMEEIDRLKYHEIVDIFYHTEKQYAI